MIANPGMKKHNIDLIWDLAVFTIELTRQERTEEDVWVPALAKSLISTVIYWASFVSRGLYSGSDFTVYYELFLVVSTGTFYEILYIILLISPIATSSVYHVL